MPSAPDHTSNATASKAPWTYPTAAFLSGFAGMGYQIVWTRLGAVGLGHDTFAVVGSLAGFLGGTALGALGAGRAATRTAAPGRAFAAFQLALALFGWASPQLVLTLSKLPALPLPRVAWFALFLLPGTFCIGASWWPLVAAHDRARRSPTGGRAIGELHAAHTVGALLGVSVTMHLGISRLGSDGCAAGLALVCTMAAVVAGRRADGPRPATSDEPRFGVEGDPDPDLQTEPWWVVALLGVTGFLGMGLETTWVLILGQRLEGTIYTFANLLAVYLVGTAVGSAAYAWAQPRWARGRPATLLAILLWTLAATTMASTATAPMLANWGDDPWSEWAVAGLTFGPSTLVMGAMFAHATALTIPRWVGRGYAANMVGAALGPVAFTFWILPEHGYRDSVFVAAYGYLLAFAAFTWVRRFRPGWWIAAVMLVLAGSWLAPPSLTFVSVEPPWRIRRQVETVMGVVTVSELPSPPGSTAPPLTRLRVGQHFRMGGARAFGERRMGALPMLLHPDPGRVLFLGVGTGATLRGAADPRVLHADAVELVPEIVDMLDEFTSINGGIHHDPRVTIHVGDARRFVAESSGTYDVVVADLFHPGRDGAAGLFTREHFARCRDALRPGGRFVQWLPLHQLDRRSLSAIVRGFVEVFPSVDAWLGVYNVQTPAVALVGADAPWVLDIEALSPRLDREEIRAAMLSDPRDWIAARLLGGDALRAWAGAGPINTDLRPVATFGAARAAYRDAPEQLGWDNLVSLLDASTPLELERIDDPAGRVTPDLPAFATALSLYLRAERDRAVRATQGASISAGGLRHLLDAYDVAPEFVPARGLLRALARSDPQLAETISTAVRPSVNAW